MSSSSEKDLALDIDVERLITVTEGGSLAETARGFSVSGLSERLRQEQKRADARNTLLVKIMVSLSHIFRQGGSGNLNQALNTAQILETQLADAFQMTEKASSLLIRLRGRTLPGQGKTAARHDFVICFGPLVVDLALIQFMATRDDKALNIESQFVSAAQALAANNINTLRIELVDPDDDKGKVLARSLEALCRYARSRGVEQGTCDDQGQACLALIHGPDNETDANLSLLAAVNRLNPHAMEIIVSKVLPLWINAPENSALGACVTLFDAVFTFEKLRQQLLRPVVEINNLRWLVTTRAEESLTGSKARMARVASKALGSDSPKTARTLVCLYDTDYGKIDGYQLVERIKLFSDLLDGLEKHALPAERDTLLSHLFSVLRDSLEHVPDTVFDDLATPPGSMESRNSKGEVIKRPVDDRLWEMVVFFRKRSITRSKIKAMLTQEIYLDEMDYDVLGEDFGFSEHQAKRLVNILITCFDKQGHFLRPIFEKNLAAFAAHEKIFEFLWHYLKEHLHKNERVAFLNALQLLIDKLKNPRNAIRVLLNDFAFDPNVVQFFDRNGLMLVNLLMRKYSKELHQTTETTPEEVLLVKEGLDEQRVLYARQIMDEERERFFGKVRTVRLELKKSLDPYAVEWTMPASFMFTLEREVFMLFALVGGVVGVAALRSGLREYGNPNSEIWAMAARANALGQALGTLQVIIRGIKRVGERSDIVAVSELEATKTDFYRLHSSIEHREQVRQVLKWA
ncbi:MAG: hypothetical protein QMD09_10250, partial [Desulfatibacillaceae bacterium]|nr:hypothetical protein [Desulfatibacillaceae bacterium]